MAALPFGLAAGLIARVALSATRYTMESWQSIPIDLGLAQASLNVVSLLELNNWLNSVRFFDEAPLLVIGGVTLIVMALVGSFGSMLGGIGALVYNSVASFSGGLAIDLEALD